MRVVDSTIEMMKKKLRELARKWADESQRLETLANSGPDNEIRGSRNARAFQAYKCCNDLLAFLEQGDYTLRAKPGFALEEGAMTERVPIINGCASELDRWSEEPDGSLVYRFAVNLNGSTCPATGKKLSSCEIHELTRERRAKAGTWIWTWQMS